MAGKETYCQSCGMPMDDEALFGTEAGGGRTDEFCLYCYEDGAYKQPDMTMQQMTDLCASYMVKDGMAEDEARALLARQLPHLRRWKAPSSS